MNNPTTTKVHVDLSELFDLQAKLDNYIAAQVAVDFATNDYNFTNHRMALVVEICEFANELQYFKWWKRQANNVNWQKVWEEYADVLHFSLSLALNNKVAQRHYIVTLLKKDKSTITQALLTLIEQTKGLHGVAETNQFLTDLLAVGLTLTTFDQITTYYKAKNAINFARQKNKY